MENTYSISREQFTMARMSSDTELKIVLKNMVGIGSRGHVDNFNCDTTLLSISVSASTKELILLQQELLTAACLFYSFLTFVTIHSTSYTEQCRHTVYLFSLPPLF